MPVELHLARHDSRRDAPPLLIAHGLLGQGRNFTTLARGFAERRPVLVADMRNHGDSPWDTRMDYAAMAEDLAAVIERDCGGAADVLGHSMGGKAAMRLALDRPGVVNRLIVADIAPVAYTHTHMPLIEAMRGLDLGALRNRAQADKALADEVPDRATRAFLLQNLQIERDGEEASLRWKPNLDVLAAAMPRLIGWEEEDWPAFDKPALFLSGGESDYVQPAHREAILRLFPETCFDSIDGVGHWLHAQAPEAFHARIAAFLD